MMDLLRALERQLRGLLMDREVETIQQHRQPCIRKDHCDHCDDG